jgi:hypothetical protein
LDSLGWNHDMRTAHGILHLLRRDAVPSDVSHVVHVPLETINAIPHASSIYDLCIYTIAQGNGSSTATGRRGGRAAWEVMGFS